MATPRSNEPDDAGAIRFSTINWLILLAGLAITARPARRISQLMVEKRIAPASSGSLDLGVAILKASRANFLRQGRIRRLAGACTLPLSALPYARGCFGAARNRR